MRVYCYDDQQSGWGRQLFLECRSRRWDPVLVRPGRTPTTVRPGYAFYRIDQWQPHRGKAEKSYYELTAHDGVDPIQLPYEVKLYENKLAQAEKFGLYMPESRICKSAAEAERALRSFKPPFMSKSKTGSSSNNVRLVRTMAEAQSEIAQAFGRGIPLGQKSEDGRQKGYLLWQQFLPGNERAYRVVCIGRYRWMFTVGNRPGTVFASGSHRCAPSTPDGEGADVLEAANHFFDYAGTRWCGVDMCKAPDGEWKVLETTLAWGMYTLGGAIDCEIFHKDGSRHPLGYYGSDIWKLLANEMEHGFNA